MAKLRLLLWTVALGAAAVVLLQDVGWSSADPAVATMAVVRVVAGALAVYLLAATLLAIRLPRVAPRFVRRLVGTAFGIALLAAPMTASASSGSGAGAPPAPVEAPVLRRVEEPPPPPAPEVTSFVARAGPAPEQTTKVVTVEPGDHLWRVAQLEVERRLGREATDAEVGRYWLRVIEANRESLASGDPDLVFPGETVRLPS